MKHLIREARRNERLMKNYNLKTLVCKTNKKLECEKKINRKELYNSSDNTGMDNPNGELVERTNLKCLRSAILLKLLRLKNVPGRSKMSKKAARIVVLEGIVSYEDITGLGVSIPGSRKKSKPKKSIEPILKPGRGVRLQVPVGGMDVHKDVLAVAVATPKGIESERNFVNDVKGIESLIQFLTSHSVKHVAMESIAEYWQKPCWILTEAGIRVLVANPLQTKTAQGIKTDEYDARRIALAFRDGRLKPSVVCNREAIKKTQQGAKAVNRLESMCSMFDAARWITDLHLSQRGRRILFKCLELTDRGEIECVLAEEYADGKGMITDRSEFRLRAAQMSAFLYNMGNDTGNRIRFALHLEDYVNCRRMATQLRSKVLQCAECDAEFQKNLQLLLTIPGVGIGTALTILVEIVNIKFFWRSKSLVKWSGLAVRVNQSGHNKRQTGHIYKGGNKWLRQAAWVSAKLDYMHSKESSHPIGSFIRRLYQVENKHYKVAVTAGARKLTAYIYQILSQQRTFDEVFELKLLKRLEKNKQRKLASLESMIKKSSISDVLPFVIDSLREKYSEFNDIEANFASEIVSLLSSNENSDNTSKIL